MTRTLFSCARSVGRRMSKPAAVLALLLAAALLPACDKDDAETDTAAMQLNMMDESNGRTTLGASNVYINDAGNFRSSSDLLTTFGKSGRGFNAAPAIDQTATELAVVPGHWYQVFDAGGLHVFASGVCAYSVASKYLNVRADEWIYDTDGIAAGAKVSFKECRPAAGVLPEWDSHAEAVDYCTWRFPAGCEIEVDTSDAYGVRVTVEGNTVTAYSQYNGIAIPVLLRKGYLYTRTYITPW
ncbi:MAG: DUF5036 family protein [Alistipes sp.]|nr:DUF5036 family protein [Alistipes sp.]